MRKASGFLKLLFIGSVLVSQAQRPTTVCKGYYKEAWILSSLSNILVEIKKSHRMIELVLELYHRDFDTYRS